MRIITHGIDVVSIPSIKRDLENPTLDWKNRVYSDDERHHSDNSPIDVRYYASRFAGKEAVAKALGTGFSGDITWREIEILRRDCGAPCVRLSNGAEKLASELGITEWLISISYCGDIVIASVIASGP